MGTKKVDAMQTAQIIALQTDVGELRTKLNKVVTDALDISAKLNVLINDLNDFNHVMMASWSSGIYYPVLSDNWIPASTHPWGVLKSLDIWKDLLEDHVVTQTGQIGWSIGSQSYSYAIHPGWAVHCREFFGYTGPAAVSGYHNGQPPYTNIGYPLRQGNGGPKVFGWNPTQYFSPPAGGNPGGGGTAGNTGGAGSYNAPVVGGTGQGTNSDHSADAENALTKNQYDNRERLLSLEPAAATRAKKLVRNILKKLRSK
jgi:hypothetical protein